MFFSVTTTVLCVTGTARTHPCGSPGWSARASTTTIDSKGTQKKISNCSLVAMADGIGISF